MIANRVRLMGTVRTFTPTVKALVRRRIDEVAAGVAACHGPSCAIQVKVRFTQFGKRNLQEHNLFDRLWLQDSHIMQWAL